MSETYEKYQALMQKPSQTPREFLTVLEDLERRMPVFTMPEEHKLWRSTPSFFRSSERSAPTTPLFRRLGRSWLAWPCPWPVRSERRTTPAGPARNIPRAGPLRGGPDLNPTPAHYLRLRRKLSLSLSPL